MGNSLTGREVVVGLKKAATWHTAVECAAGDGLLITAESLKQNIEELLDNSLGSIFHHASDKGKRESAGNLEGFMRYEGIDVALALIMGTAGVPSQQGATAAYTNSYVMANNLSGLFATIAALKKSDIVHEHPSLKLHGFTLSAEMNAPMNFSMPSIFDKLVVDSAVNTHTTIANVTYPDNGNRIIMNEDSTFKINDESAGAVVDGDKVYPNSIELAFTRPLEGDLLMGNEGYDEPYGTDFPDATLTVNFPRYNDANHAFFADWEAFTRKKAELYFKGALIADTYYYELKVSMPNMKLVDMDAPASGPGKIPTSLTFRLLGTDSAPTGMSGITKPFQLDVQNTRTTDPLA